MSLLSRSPALFGPWSQDPYNGDHDDTFERVQHLVVLSVVLDDAGSWS